MVEMIKKVFGSLKVAGNSCQHVNAAQAKELMEEIGRKNYEIIDVRTPDEFRSGHLKGAKNINLFDSTFSQKVGQLDTDKTYFLICRSGNRSGSACSNMMRLGFAKVYNISGGMMYWR
jgi:rhodanese-related sulfurtransferase